MSDSLFLICSDLSAEMPSNGKNALLRLAFEIQRNNCEVKVVFTINQHPHIINPFTHLFGQSMSQFVGAESVADIATLVKRYNRIRYAQARLNIFGLSPLEDMSYLQGKNYVVIYPEAFSQNPLNAENVVRFYGFKPGILNDHDPEGAQYSDAEFKVASSKNLLMDKKHTLIADHILFDPFVDHIFVNENLPDWNNRQLALIYKGKNKIADKPINYKDALFIDRDWPDRFTLSQLMPKAKYLFTYDPYTFLNVEAILCGTVPIFCDNWHVNDEEIDGGELGPIPRFTLEDYESGRVDHDFFQQQRQQLVLNLAKLQEEWPNNVSLFIDKALKKFGLTKKHFTKDNR